MTPRFVLIQAREPDEPTAPQEHRSFAEEMGVDPARIDCVSALSGRLDADALCDGYDAVLVGGSGRFSVTGDQAWLPNFFDTLGEVAGRDFPMFASCFGFQGLCVALGAEVITDEPRAEVGSHELTVTPEGRADPLFGELPATFHAQLGHKDRATALPAGAVWLARSERCPYQALRLGSRVYATQFHPELSADANRKRFLQYWPEYAHVFGEPAARKILDDLRDSSHASGLLRSFVTTLTRSPPR